MSYPIQHQHLLHGRQSRIVPADDAGQFRDEIILYHAAQRVLCAAGVACDAPITIAAETYRGGYARTCLTGHQDGSPGRIGTAYAGCRLEGLTGNRMAAWREHWRARASMRPCDAIEVDCCVLDEMEMGIDVVKLLRGLRALALYYRTHAKVVDYETEMCT